MIAADMIGVSRVQGRATSVVEQETWIRHWLSTGPDTICSHSFNIFHMRNSAASPLCLTAKGNYFYPSQPPENFHPFQSSQLPSRQSSPTSRHRQSFHASLEKLRAKSLYPHTEELDCLDTEPNSCDRIFSDLEASREIRDVHSLHNPTEKRGESYPVYNLWYKRAFWGRSTVTESRWMYKQSSEKELVLVQTQPTALDRILFFAGSWLKLLFFWLAVWVHREQDVRGMECLGGLGKDRRRSRF
jgi:hypothetical protein